MFQIIVLVAVFLAASATDVRLVDKDGSTNTVAGRVEVRVDGDWGQVCGEGFASVDAGVVCKSLGYVAKGGVETGQHGVGSAPIVIGNVECTGQEPDILQCPHRKQTTCSTNIAAVDCRTSLTATGSIGQEAGIIAAIIICLVAIIGVLVLFGACLWRNDFCVGTSTQA